MKIIISESQVKYLIKKYFKKDFSDKIQMIQSWDDLPSKFKRVMGEKRVLNLYLNDFGPMYLILVDGEEYDQEYLAQERENGWAIVDEGDRPIKESKFMDILGISPLGLSLGEFINAYIEELPV